MAESKREEQKAERKIEIPAFAYVICVFVILGLGAWWFLEREIAPTPPPVLTAEARAYVRNLKLANVDMKATESLAKQLLVEIEGKITNNGDRTLRLVEINCVFYDPYGQVVLRRRIAIVTKKMGGLAPGEMKAFRLPFDDIPESWNQAVPQLVIAGINFG